MSETERLLARWKDGLDANGDHLVSLWGVWDDLRAALRSDSPDRGSVKSPTGVCSECGRILYRPASTGGEPDEPLEGGWTIERGVTCVVCPDCAFTFDAAYEDTDGGYSCPACSEGRAETASRAEQEAGWRDAWAIIGPDGSFWQGPLESEPRPVQEASDYRVVRIRIPDSTEGGGA